MTVAVTGSEAAAGEVSEKRRGPVVALLVALRPRQWLKNSIVVAAPLAAATLLLPRTLWLTAVAIVAMCLASSAGYLVNDVRDVAADRLHPVKRLRPIAARELGAGVAVVVAGLLGLGALALAAMVDRPGLVLVIAVYLATTVAYSLWLKHEAVLDIAIVASGFVLRALAGGMATGVAPSRWFLIVAAFGSLFLVAGKRASELVRDDHDPTSARRALGDYSADYLRFVWQLAAAITITAYCLWGFGLAPHAGRIDWEPISVAPFVLALLRYAQHVERGDAGEPETLALQDRTLQVLALVWLVVFTLGAYHL
ncbi:MAG TPA: decaprenyl-phosphate phosphoribosyltransferase [Actinomycetes bacterium]|nr:decaprenyl-phosphate phosphoribosyltransferase [Actinomycetes bacterium]